MLFWTENDIAFKKRFSVFFLLSCVVSLTPWNYLIGQMPYSWLIYSRNPAQDLMHKLTRKTLHIGTVFSKKKSRNTEKWIRVFFYRSNEDASRRTGNRIRPLNTKSHQALRCACVLLCPDNWNLALPRSLHWPARTRNSIWNNSPN